MSYDKLKQALQQDEQRADKARREQSTLMQATRILGVLGFLVILPTIGGAYLGVWLDSFSDDYSVRWTVGCILLGLIVGSINAYLALRD